MKVLVVGSGGREHALCWKLRQSPKCEKLFCAPGNPGIAQEASCVSISVGDVSGLLKFAQSEGIDLTIVGPEAPLALGIVDEFRKVGLKIFGPTKEAAQLEASKAFTKDVLTKAGVRTARYHCAHSKEESEQILKNWKLPVVIKADGLAAGKGVVICKSSQEVEDALEFTFQNLKSKQIVIEEFLEGVEASFIVMTDGEMVIPLATSHDYKRIFDNHEGPNTGGMGTLSPTPRVPDAMVPNLVETIIKPTLNELARRGIVYTGFMYAGLMINPNGVVNVIEYNARLGDPETQVIMRRMQGDFLEVVAALSGVPEVSQVTPLKWAEETALCVVLASKGYPESSHSGDVISGISNAEELPSIQVFHAGTRTSSSGVIETAGGRVLGVTGLGSSLEDVRTKTYDAISKISFDGMQSRKDIGY